ncbi:abl interactor 2 isoform X4 [Dermacentor andersoni]|uniref:abl interactor 2 isoform X4 n=1 Tax=Dermacentor andersoni TaxID=34620 RepID=UPI0024163FF9|nr:abl interactor 2-like isoform X4 [Dermacentor andersoni]
MLQLVGASVGLNMPSVMADLMTLIQHEIPDGRQNIHDSHTNLEKVAEYCEANYFQSENKHAALEETKKFATQSLASVAYQINTLAYNLLHLLDLQTAQLSEMESHINHIGQTVMIHKEKVARREIGVLTANKSTLRQHKILAPASQERPVKYIRRPIDYTVLDEVGHGLRTSSAGNGGANKARRIPSSQALMNAGPAPTTKPPTPPQANRGVTVGSLTRGSREYRTPAPPIAPPQVPSNYAANYPLGHPRRGSGYSTLPAHGHHGSSHPSSLPPSQMTPPPALASQPQVGMVHPMSQHTMGHHHHSMPHHTLNHPSHMGQQQQPSGVAQNPAMQAGVAQNSMVAIAPGSVVHPMTQNPVAPGAMSVGAMGHQMPKVPTSMVPSSMLQSQHYGSMAPAHQPPPPSDPMTSSLTDRLPEPPPPHIMTGGIVPTAEYERHGNVSPPLPPPPPPEPLYPGNYVPPSPPAYGHQRPDAQRDSVPKTYLEKVVAIYDYEADKDDELSFSENSVIYVIKKNDDGWYEGVMNGVTGLFPGNYVEPCM